MKEWEGSPKLRGRISTPGSSIAMQRDFNKLEGWTDRKHVKFSKDKCEVLPWGWKCPLQQHKLGTDCLARSSARGACARGAG